MIHRRQNIPVVKYADFRRAMRQAYYDVHKAVKEGRLPDLRKTFVLRADCKKERAVGYEHRDYKKPLDVIPVCCQCNNRRGCAVA